jgi:hypothetical protein
MIASAETAAHIGELHVDARWLVRGVGFAEQEGDRLGSLIGRLHTDDELKVLAASVVPSKSAFRLEKHRVDRLRLKLPLQHQMRRIVGRKLSANVFAVTRRFRIIEPVGIGSRAQIGRSVFWNLPGLTQPFLTGE